MILAETGLHNVSERLQVPVYNFPFAEALHETLLPLLFVLPVSMDLKLYQVEVTVLNITAEGVDIIPARTTIPPPPRARTNRQQEQDDAEAEGDDSDLDFQAEVEADDGLSLCSASDSELEIAEAAPLDAELAVPVPDEPERDLDAVLAEDDVPEGPRAPAGQYVIWSNEYFWMADNPALPDLNIRIRTQWRTAAEMGRAPGSRSFVPQRFGEARDFCPQTALVLRAWALSRMANQGWKDRRAVRQAVFVRESEQLAAEVAECELHPAARQFFRQFSPHILR